MVVARDDRTTCEAQAAPGDAERDEAIRRECEELLYELAFVLDKTAKVRRAILGR